MTKPSSSFTIALVGRPNVGKSTLFNRIVGKKHAIVEDTPGVTRDWREGEGSIGPLDCRVIDTAGLENAASNTLEHQMLLMTEKILERVDLIFFVIDGRTGITPLDQHFAKWLREKSLPIRVVVNKCEGNTVKGVIAEAFRLGLGEPVPISAAHGEGLADLYEAAALVHDLKVDRQRDEEEPDTPPVMQIAIVGRPNAGKSTLLNQLIGEERVLTGPMAGITRDAVGVDITMEGIPCRIIDTAGIRRRKNVQSALEKMSLESTFRSIQYAHVVVLLLDAELGLESQDIAIAEKIIDEGRALVIAVNKWDLVKDKTTRLRELEKMVGGLHQIAGVPLVMISASENLYLKELIAACQEAYAVWNRRISTHHLNEWLAEALANHPLPLGTHGRRIRIKYITQHKSRPPSFSLFCSQTEGIEAHYLRYLQNTMRQHFKLFGVPLRLMLKKTKNPFAK
jgi:GTP-binding protein